MGAAAAREGLREAEKRGSWNRISEDRGGAEVGCDQNRRVCKRVSNEILRVQDNDEDAEIPDRICSFQASN